LVVDIARALWHLRSTGRVPASAPRPITFAGFQGEHLEFTVTDESCPANSYWIFDALAGSLRPDAGPTPGYVPFYSELPYHRMWVLDVDGIPILIDAMSGPDVTEDDLDELQSVLDSIRIERTTEPSSLGTCTLDFTDPSHPGALLEEPYAVTMGPTRYELRGPAPADDNGDPLSPEPPIAQIDWTAEGWDPGAGLIEPTDAAVGFTTHTGVNGPQGSMVFDAPGTWLVTFDEFPDNPCFRQFPVEVLPPE
jgi:hypothetical protein